MSSATSLRLAVYGGVLVIALLVWQMRVADRGPVPARGPGPPHAALPADAPWGKPPGARLQGVVGGFYINAHVHGGQVRQLAHVVPAPCARSPWQGMLATFDERRQPFNRIGGRFTATHMESLDPDARGRVPHLRIVARGVLSPDRRRASGFTTVRVTWTRDEVPVDSCEAPVTRWEGAP